MTSAIYGLWGLGEPAEVQAMGRRLAHRGAHEVVMSLPEQAHLAWRSRTMDPQGHPGSQVPLVFAGFLTNRVAIARLLGEPVPASAPEDARLLWMLYQKLGPECFARLNGQFAIALFDSAARVLVLAVDAWATHPLYYASVGAPVGKRWAFASEYRALLAFPDLPAQVNSAVAGAVQSTKYVPVHEALLDGVYPVAPGEYVRVTASGCECRSYKPLQLAIDQHRSEHVLAAELQDSILAATRRLTDGVERIGIALSAGLDSTLTLGAVRAVAGKKPIYTYTAGFDRNDPDLARARESADYFRTIHQEIILSPEDLPALLPELVWRMEDPVAREEMLVYLVLSQRAAADVPIVLYGHMADVLFGGMPRHLLIRMAAEAPEVFREPLTTFYDYTQIGKPPRSFLGKLLVQAYYRGRQTLPPRLAKPLSGAPGKQLHLASEEPLNTALLESARSPTEVAAMERLHAWAGVRMGSVFHDRDVAQQAFRIPDRLKIHGRCRKYILRKAAAGFMPEAFTARPKGFIRMGRDQRLVRVVSAMAADLLSPQTVGARGLFNVQDMMRLQHQRKSGEYVQDQFYHLWSALMIELWQRIFVDGRGTPLTPQQTDTPIYGSHTVTTAPPPGRLATLSRPP